VRERRGSLYASDVARKAMSESARVQAQALLGAEVGDELPLFDNGLISAPDGLGWMRPQDEEDFE
jgi:uncharacterized protein YjlB